MCERCKKFEEHIADLRNKYGRLHTFWQLLGLSKKPKSTKTEELVQCDKNFTFLLKKDI